MPLQILVSDHAGEKTNIAKKKRSDSKEYTAAQSSRVETPKPKEESSKGQI